MVSTGILGGPSPVSKIFLTQPEKREYQNLGILYTNNYDQRKIDLGLLFGSIEKSNLLTAIYLATKTEMFKNLEDYSVYNNTITSNFGLTQQTIDQSVKLKKSLENVYEYSNIVDNFKTINNITTYSNDVNRKTNLQFNMLYNNETVKKIIPELRVNGNQKLIIPFETVFEYSNNAVKKTFEQNFTYTNSIDSKKIIELGTIQQDKFEKNIYLGSIYDIVSEKKLLSEPVYVKTEEKIKKIFDLGNIYNNSMKSKEMIVEKIKTNTTPKIQFKEPLRIDQKTPSEKVMSVINVIPEKNVYVENLEIDKIETEKREKNNFNDINVNDKNDNSVKEKEEFGGDRIK
jgi:hypothetical protein